MAEIGSWPRGGLCGHAEANWIDARGASSLDPRAAQELQRHLHALDLAAPALVDGALATIREYPVQLAERALRVDPGNELALAALAGTRGREEL